MPQSGPQTIGYANVPNIPTQTSISVGGASAATSAQITGSHGVIGFMALLGTAYGISLLGTWYDRHKG
jgi:hypothetical protein